jgi:SAM-dependent methyltransferase
MSAADRWRDQLEAWALPDDLLSTAEESPYGWSQDLWKRRSVMAATNSPPETVRIVAELMPQRGTLLDIGVGRGRASLPIAENHHRLIGVDESLEMLAGFTEDARRRSMQVETHEGRWPDVAAEVPAADVAMAANVAYNVADIVPFIAAMIDHARVAAVLEITERHPWAHLAPLYRAVHDLDRPDGPTADDLVAVIVEMTSHDPVVYRWERQGHVWYESWDELLDHYGRRLVVPKSERSALRRLLEPDVVVEDGKLRVGDTPTVFATIVIPSNQSRG